MAYATGRRMFLSLPAVEPGGEVSTAALAHSLASLADEILALRDAAFPVHRRSAREAIRQVSAIREFLADVAPAFLPASAAVALSELHIALQKLGNLLRDCARPGARMWVLMHSEQVSNDFRALIKSIGTALDVLPLSATDASPEVKELMRLVAEQAWKAEVGTASADALTARNVGSAIVHFENGIAPNPIDLEQIMEHLRVRSWSDCNEEILFLEDFSSSSADVDVGEHKEAALLGSLTALMIYCRVTLFDAGDDWKSGGANQVKAPPRTMNQVMNLDDLRCPISYELMLDPVTIATGHTYDRASISKWFNSGNLTCPVTGEKLTDATIVPNSTVRHVVEQLYRSNNLPIPEPTSRQRNSSKSAAATPPGSVGSAVAEATKMVAAFLVSKLASSTRREQRKAASEIRKLTKSNVFNRACMVDAGAVPWLLHLLSSREASTEDDTVAALLNLSKHPSGGRAIVDAGGLAVVVDVIRVALKVESQQNAAAILFYLSSVEDCPAEIGNMPDAIPTLVELVREGSYRGKKNAVVTLFGLLLCHSNRDKILEAGAVPALIALLPRQERGDLASDAVAVLAKISEQPEGAAAIVDCAPGIPRLVEFFRSTGSQSGRENCVSALLSLCIHGGAEVVSSLRQMPALMPALYSLVTEGSARAGKKARLLIDRIHYLDEQGRPAMAPSSVQDDEAVHAQ